MGLGSGEKLLGRTRRNTKMRIVEMATAGAIALAAQVLVVAAVLI